VRGFLRYFALAPRLQECDDMAIQFCRGERG
jgi:hypothetical protein